MTETDALREILAGSKKAVFLGGAGVSTGSGIPDFRGTTGLYNQPQAGGLAPEELLSHECLTGRPELFFDYYRHHMIYPDAKPNGAHLALAELERRGILTGVITQNIDGLHEAAGSRRVIALHGSVAKNYCVRCGKKYTLGDVLATTGVPHCSACGGMIRPDVVMYGEGLSEDDLIRAEAWIENADTLLVGGTSLTVQPAASLVRFFRGKHFVILNLTPTPYDRFADLIVREPIETVLSEAIRF